MTPLDRAIKAAGSLAALAAGIREQGAVVSNSAPGMWKQRGGRVPAEYCPAIEAFTTSLGDRVTCEELRPDVAWHVLRSAGAPDESPVPHPDTVQPVTAVTGSIPAEQGQPGDRRQGERRKVCIPVPPELDLRGTKQDPRAAGGAA